MKEQLNILYFFPYEIVNKNHGNITRAIQLLEYFCSRQNQFNVDFVTEAHENIDQEPELLEKMFPHINSFFLQKKFSKKNYAKYYFKSKVPSWLYKKQQKRQFAQIKSQATLFEKQQFDDILKTNQYDFIIISYVYYASLVRDNPHKGNAKLIIDTHDFMTGQYKKRESFSLGVAFEEEMKILNGFDDIWAISSDELYLFSQFAPKAAHHFIPVMYDSNTSSPRKEPVYDLIYVASDNPNNQESAKWFFSNVYPLIPKNIKICVIGRITDYIPRELPNVVSVKFAEDLKEYYLKSKVALCPMLEGTGIKVKVVEALSFGLPVVCTLRGLDGLPQKQNNGCLLGDNAEDFASKIIELLQDKESYVKASKNAERMFNDFFTKSIGYHNLDRVFKG